MTPEAMREKLLAAFEGLGIIGSVSTLHRTLDLLVTIGQRPSLPLERQTVVRRSLGRAGKKETARELDRLAVATDKQVTAIEALHAPARAALAQQGVVNINDVAFLEAQRLLAAKARAAAQAIPDEDVGLDRPRDRRPQYVSGILLRAYGEILGRHPERPGQSPGLEKLTREVFAVLGLVANPKAALRAAFKEQE